MFKEYLEMIIAGVELNEEQMSEMITAVLSGDITDAQIGAMMAALATRGETYAELAGAAKAMRRKAQRIQPPGAIVVDTCGTGGDGAQTFNISTTTAFVVAGCGVIVAKHGNRSVSSQCGSADLLEALGVKIDTAPEIVEEALYEVGIGFLFAPVYHSAMRHAARARTEIGLRSIFNMLGPLTNPAGANCQLLGVYAPELTEMFARALSQLGARQAMVVHGHDGLDEISVCAPTRISELKAGLVKTFDLSPQQFFGRLAEPAALAGGDSAANAAITREILDGGEGDKRNVVILNAAAALICAGKAPDFPTGIDLAARSIDSGAAREKLASLVTFTTENG